jgi:hypothetical protein
MTKDDIIKLAREAGFERVVAIHPDGSKTVTVAPVPELEAFANLVAAAEREACAQIVDDFGGEWMCDSHMLSKAIRARGNT